MSQNKILDVGCGNRKIDGAVGMDREPLNAVDIVHDLDSFPYPQKDNSFDRIVLRHVLEHLTDVLRVMEEVHRIGKPGALVEIHTPHFTSLNSYNDPTHKHQFSLLAFEFFCGGTMHGYLVKSRFKMVKREVFFWPLHDKLPFTPYHWIGLKWIAERHPNFFERFLCFLFPIMEFRITLQVEK